jgi:hypothetical protein
MNERDARRFGDGDDATPNIAAAAARFGAAEINAD